MSEQKRKGTAAEKAVADFLSTLRETERRALSGRHDHGDIAGWNGLACWEIKSYLDLGRALSEGLPEAIKEARGAEVPILVTRRRNQPAAKWYATTTLEQMASLILDSWRK